MSERQSTEAFLVELGELGLGESERIERMVRRVMAGIDDLKQAIEDLQTQATATDSALSSLATEISTLQDQIAALQGSGSQVTDADLEALAQQVQSISQGLQTAVTASQGSGPVPPAPEPPAPSPTPVVEPPAPSPSSADAARSTYTFDGDPATIDHAVWPIAPFVSQPGGAQLYWYANDVSDSDANGDGLGGVWHLYTGEKGSVTGEVTQPSDGGVSDLGSTPDPSLG